MSSASTRFWHIDGSLGVKLLNSFPAAYLGNAQVTLNVWFVAITLGAKIAKLKQQWVKMEQIWLKKVIFLWNGHYILTVCASVSSSVPNGICKISHTGGKQPVRAVPSLSSCQSLANSDQTVWLNMNQYSVTVMPISHLKCFQKHLVVYRLAVKWERLWPGSHVEVSWGNTKHRPPAGAQPIGTLSPLKWPVIGQSLPSRAKFFKAWKQSH